MARRWLTLAMWGMLALGVVACRGCFLPDRNLGRRVTEGDIVGTWRMTPESLKLLEREGFQPVPAQTFTMKFTAEGAVEYASADRFDPKAYATLSGTWKLLHNPTGPDEGRANVLDLSLRRRGEPRTYLVSWGFDEKDGKLRLWSFLGDPDSWEFVEYTKDG